MTKKPNQPSMSKAKAVSNSVRKGEAAACAAGWQKHSVRGFMAGALKKHHGLPVNSEKTDQGGRYWIAGEPRE